MKKDRKNPKLVPFQDRGGPPEKAPAAGSGEETAVHRGLQEERDDQTYKIYNYLKAHPAVALTCVSAIVVALSFLVNAAIYLNDSAYLNYWNIGAVYTTLDRPNQFYSACGNIVYVIFAVIAFTLLNHAHEAYIPAKRLILYYRAQMGNLQKENRRIYKEQKVLAQKIRRERKRDPQGQTDGEAVLSKMAEGRGNMRASTKNAKKCLRKLKWNLRMVIFIHIVLAVFLLGAGMVFSLLFRSALTTFYFVFSAGLSVSFIILIYFFYTFLRRQSVNKKEIREKAAADNISAEELAEAVVKSKHKYPLFKKITLTVSDSTIHTILAMVVFQTATFLLLFSLFGHVTARSQTSFPIVNTEETTYAVIYNNGERAVLEECAIDGDSLEIHAQKQKIASTEGLAYEIIKFKSVEKVDET